MKLCQTQLTFAQSCIVKLVNEGLSLLAVARETGNPESSVRSAIREALRKGHYVRPFGPDGQHNVPAPKKPDSAHLEAIRLSAKGHNNKFIGMQMGMKEEAVTALLAEGRERIRLVAEYHRRLDEIEAGRTPAIPVPHPPKKKEVRPRLTNFQRNLATMLKRGTSREEVLRLSGFATMERLQDEIGAIRAKGFNVDPPEKGKAGRTVMQQEVVAMLAGGATHREIAAALGISEATSQGHSYRARLRAEVIAGIVKRENAKG